jgi:lipoprotein-anchoring transpeptidase ErfK/SrfK
VAAVSTAARSTPRRGFSILRLWPYALLLLLVAGIAAAGLMMVAINRAAVAYNGSRVALQQDVQAARTAGFTDDDIKQVVTGLAAMSAVGPPRLGERLSFYQHQKDVADNLRVELVNLEATRLAAYRSDFDTQAVAAKAALDQDSTLGVVAADLAGPQKTLDGVTSQLASANTAAELRKLIAAIAPVAAQAAELGRAQAAENLAIDQRTVALKAAHPNDIEAIRKDGQAALVASRNDGTLAAWLKLHQLDGDVARVEAASGALAAADLDQVARAAATIIFRNDSFHTKLVAAMPAKVIEVSINDQHLWAYDHGKIVFDTLVTTGRPQLPTDTGPMSVLTKSSPWKMHSPWPRGSQWWYPDTVVRKVLWFTATGEGLHDAVWEPTSMYGPGSQNIQSIASHGCIHLPGTTVDWMYDWAPVATPVIIIPGDGTATSAQLKHDTIDTAAGQTAPHGS